MNIEYMAESDKTFDAVVSEIERLAVEKSFRVLHVHDVQATLAEKGLQREPLKIIEICKGRFAYEALRKDINVSLFMPCFPRTWLSISAAASGFSLKKALAASLPWPILSPA